MCFQLSQVMPQLVTQSSVGDDPMVNLVQNETAVSLELFIWYGKPFEGSYTIYNPGHMQAARITFALFL